MSIRSVLVANRGEIALRVIRTCRELGIRSVAVYSDADRLSPHTAAADEAYPIGPAPARESYLRGDRILAVAKRSGCDAIHPGYGFLSENADFADAVHAAGLIFVGPPAAVQRALGDKAAARAVARAAGVPVAAGSDGAVSELEAVAEAARRAGYPVLLKPAGGGGGKGMRIVRAESDLAAAWRGATGEAQSSFGAAALIVERYISPARHVEVQLIADGHGGVVALGERDCSVQRRHQKLIEETPGPSVDASLRERLFAAASGIATAARYVNAGTAEFLVGADGSFVFLEVNTRLQVEHPVTELVTGLDLVALQLRIAEGEPLPFTQGDLRLRGAAIECRVTAEDAFGGFLPGGGVIGPLRLPAGPGVRVDAALADGLAVPTDYDPLLAKIITWGTDRPAALARMRRALAETAIGGPPTCLPFLRHALAEADFNAGRYDTGYVDAHWPAVPELSADAAQAAALVAVLQARSQRSVPAPAGEGSWSRAAREDGLR